MVQPLVVIVYSLLKTFFKEYNISQQIILKLVVFCASILFSYFIFYFTREKERKNVKALLPSSSRRYEMIFKPVSARKQVFDAYIFNVPIIACLVLYLSILFIKCVRTLVALALVRVLAVRHVLVGYE